MQKSEKLLTESLWYYQANTKTLTDSITKITLRKSYNAQNGINIADAMIAINSNKRKWLRRKSLIA